MKKTLLALLILISAIGSAQVNGFEKLDTYFNILEKNNKFMGAVAIYKSGEIVYNNTIGYSDVASQTKIKKDTKFRIGSISKTFTSCLVLIAIEEGKLSLETTLDKFYTEIKNSEQITIQNLLNHTSGIGNFTSNPQNHELFHQPISKNKLVEVIVKEGVEFKPNEKYKYSNSNYVLLTFILEKIYNQEYKDILKEKIIEPLKLNNTLYGGKIKTSKNEAHSYTFKDNWEKEKETDMSVPQGAGAIISTTSDLITFIKALFQGNIVSDESLKLMKPNEEQYALGLMKFPFNNKQSYGHGGAIDGFRSGLIIIPEYDIVVCALFNGVNGNKNKVSKNLYRVAVGKSFKIPKFEKKLTKVENTEQYLGTYSAPKFPLKITITANKGQLYGQATGQGEFKLDGYPNHVFRFEQAGIKMKFKPNEEIMLFSQGATKLKFTKE